MNTLEGHYDDIVVVDKISEGRTFSIYKARRGSKYVILKTLTTPDSMAESLLRREYELGAQLSHPSIINTIGFESDTPVGPAIVLEYVNGISLKEYISGNPTTAQRRSVLKDILSGVEYLHKRGILHNDLKPENIMINGNNTARIIDLGFSESEDNIYSGAFGGSAGYSAPEIISGKGSAGSASDIYSVGKITSFIFGGRRYDNLIRKCLNDNPLKRPHTIQAFRNKMLLSDLRPYLASFAVIVVFISTLPIINVFAQKNDKERIRTEMTIPFDKALRHIKHEDYKETAMMYYNLYLKDMNHYLDSMQTLYPVYPDGSMHPTFATICDIFKEHNEHLNSIISELPTIQGLQPAVIDSIFKRFNERFRPEEYGLKLEQ